MKKERSRRKKIKEQVRDPKYENKMCDFFEEKHPQEFPLVPALIENLKQKEINQREDEEEEEEEQKSKIFAEQTLRFSKLFMLQNTLLNDLEPDSTITDSGRLTSLLFYVLSMTYLSL